MQSVTGSRRRVRVRGIVQGVGYRPFVYGLALELGLAGWVLNDAAGVVADVQGRPEALDAFCRRLATDAPPTAAVEDVDWADLDPQPRAGFVIAASADDGSGPVARTLPPPDLATCDDCLAEVADPTDRRYRHPFVSCTACGPRFTILTGAPYDRAATSMARFALCADCRREYGDPRDRRFHAQTVACRACGPVLDLLEAPPSASAAHAAPPEREQLPHGDAALARAREILAAGGIVAVKGIGGYHLACDATSSEAVGRLRARKQRGDKPFAVLVRDLATAREFADVDDVEAGLLTSSRRPVVLLRPRPGAGVADEVAPRGGRVGLMLPPSALHLLLLGLPTDPPGPAALVLTSGNLSGEPIVTDDEEAVRRLSGIADAWLRHDRPIEVACDDSVVGGVDGARRLVVDTHPLYRSARGAEDAAVEQGMVLQRVQHHHAHVASVLAENGYASEQPVLGVAFDGSGHCADGAVWGGEVLLAGYGGYRRFAHLSYVPLAGGDAAVRRPYRMALAHLDAAGVAWDEALPCVAVAPTRERSVLAHQLRTGLACVPTSSMGRLFDAVASLAGVCHEVGYEAQAAMEFQALAEQALADQGPAEHADAERGAYPLPLLAPPSGSFVWDAGALVRAVADDVRAGVPAGVVAVRFHRGVAAAVVRMALHARGTHGVSTVALSGGVFTNALLLSLTSRGLREAGFDVLRHRRVPANDGGLALGQVVVGATPAVRIVDLAEATAHR